MSWLWEFSVDVLKIITLLFYEWSILLYFVFYPPTRVSLLFWELFTRNCTLRCISLFNTIFQHIFIPRISILVSKILAMVQLLIHYSIKLENVMKRSVTYKTVKWFIILSNSYCTRVGVSFIERWTNENFCRQNSMKWILIRFY